MLATDSALTSDGCQFFGNTATRGGAIYSSASRLAITNSVLSDSVARATGGAIHTESGGSLLVHTSNFTENQAGAQPCAA